MGEDNKDNGANKASDEKKNEEKKEADDEIVLKVDMHCEACVKKVVRALRGFPGVEEVTVNRKANTLVVKGKEADPMKLCERVQKKSGRKVEVLSPLPKPSPEHHLPPDENKDDAKEEVNKDQPPQVITVELRVQMHCEACAHILRKRVRKIKGVESVETDVGNNKVTVKGVIADPSALVKDVYKKTRKKATLLVKDEEKKEDQAEKKEDGNKKEEAKKENNHEEGKQDDAMMRSEVINRYEYYWPTRYNYMEYHNNSSYHPQFFSDENPNACSIM